MSQSRNTPATPRHGHHTARRRAWLGAATLSLVLAACTDAPTGVRAPSPDGAPQHSIRTVTSTTVTAVALTRNIALASPVHASAVIGPEGGVLKVPGTGLTVTVPRGAVSAATTFTVSAPAGSGVWYHFGPHGARFAQPLVLTQELGLTTFASLTSLKGLEAAYFADGTQDHQSNTAPAKEFIPVSLNATRTQVSFKVSHFSGYMVSMGRK